MDSTEIQVTGAEESKKEIPIVENPSEFMEGFFSSELYVKNFATFYEKKNLAPDVTEAEKQEAFLTSGGDRVKYALLDYGKDEAHFKYNPQHYPPDVRAAINNYVDFVSDMGKMTREGEGTVESLDETRRVYHTEAAEALAKAGIVPTHKLGRALARLVLIDKKMETFEDARTEDIVALKRKMGIK